MNHHIMYLKLNYSPLAFKHKTSCKNLYNDFNNEPPYLAFTHKRSDLPKPKVR
jgi:hypothetical protein